MVSNNSTSNSVSSTMFTSFVSELNSLHVLSLSDRSVLVGELADYLESDLRAQVFEVLDIGVLSQFVMPAQSDYSEFSEYQRAARNSVRLFESLGLFEVSPEGRIIDHNALFRPVLNDGGYYSKIDDGPALLEA